MKLGGRKSKKINKVSTIADNECGGMFLKAIQNYINTKCDLNLVKARLDFLLEKKKNIHNMYIDFGSENHSKTNFGSFKSNQISLYIRKLFNKDLSTNNSLIQEIILAKQEIQILEEKLEQMEKILYQMKGISRELFVEVACNGLNPTKAVEKVSEKENVDYRTGWRYYKKIKPELKKLDKFSL